MKNILVTGAGGQLGQEIQEFVKSLDYLESITWFFADRVSLDITNELSVKDFFKLNAVNICINCAAYTGVDKAEEDKEKCVLVNSTAAKYLATASQKNQGIFIYISSDYVFDGTKITPYIESDVTNPINFYGQTKRDGELYSLANCDKSIVIRASWLYSKTFGKNFYKTIQKLGAEKESLNVVSDQIGTPTNASHLAKYIVDLVLSDSNANYGIFHFADNRICSWAEFAVSIMAENNLNCRVNPIPSSEYPTLAKRPAYSPLASSKTTL
jgi:dTDP-4-dehydrorhamnose reductase